MTVHACVGFIYECSEWWWSGRNVRSTQHNQNTRITLT